MNLHGTLKIAYYNLVASVLSRIGFRRTAKTCGILLFKPDAIGDFVLATGVIHLFCKEFGPENVTLLISRTTQLLAQVEFPKCQFLVVNPLKRNLYLESIMGWYSARRAIGRRRYRQLISLRHHRSFYDDILLASLKAESTVASKPDGNLNSVSFANARFRAKTTIPYPLEAHSAIWCKELEAHRQLAETVLSRPISREDIMPRFNTVCVVEGDYLLLSPLAGSAIRDCSGTQILSSLRAAQLPPAARVIVCGEISRSNALNSLAAMLRNAMGNVVEVVQPPDLISFLQWIAGARCVLAMESAAAHVATALDKPGVFILGGGHFGYFAPWQRSHRQRWLYNPLECFGCKWECRQPYVQCIADLPSDLIGKELKEIWNLSLPSLSNPV